MYFKKFIGNKEFYTRLIVIAVPILIQNVITNFVSLIDNIMVGRIGTEQMTGVAVVNQLIFVFNLCIFGAISGPGIFSAQFFGKGDHKGVRDTFRMKLIMVSSITIIAELLLFFYGEHLVSFFLHPGEEKIDLALTMEYAKKYMSVMLIGLPAFAVMQAYSDTLRSTNQTVLPMKASVAAVITNMVLNYILIFGKLGAPKLGVIGAAIATVVSRYLEFFIVIIWTHIKHSENEFIVGAYRSFFIPSALVKSIIAKGFPLLVNEALWSLGMTMILQAYSLRGMEVISAQNISSTISNLFFCSYFAFGNAISIIVGQHLGSGQLKKAVDDTIKLIFACVVTCIAVGVVMIILAPLIPEIYNTLDSVKVLASQFLIISAVMMPLHGFCHSAYFTLRSGGKTFITFLFDSCFIWCITLPVAYILSRYTQIPILPLFLVIQSLELVKVVIGAILLKSKIWVNNLTN